MAGWIKVHRQLMDSPIFDNEKLFKVFMYCLMKASHKEHKQLVGKQVITLKPGQFVFGRKKASAEANMSASTLWSYMLTLKNLETIDIKSNNKFSVVTIVNWGLYQQEEENHDSKRNNKRTTNEQQNDSSVTTNEQQMDTNKNVKNVENDNNEKNVRSIVYDDAFQEVFQSYQENIEMNPSPMTIQKIQHDFDSYGKEIMMHAIEKSAFGGNHDYKFINWLLNDWKKRNLKTVDAIKVYEQQRQTKQTYSNKTNQPAELTPAWIKDLENNRQQEQRARTPEEIERGEALKKKIAKFRGEEDEEAEEKRKLEEKLKNFWKE